MTATNSLPHRDRARRRAAVPYEHLSPRGDDVAPRFVRSIDATLLWLDDAPLATSSTWLVELGERTVRAHFAAIARADEGDAPALGAADHVAKHAWTRARLTLHEPLALDAPESRRATLTLVDDVTHRAVATGTVDA